jgi:hypothetical protein
MWNHKWSVVAALLSFHCGGSTQSADPVEEPKAEETPAAPEESAPAESAASAEESSASADGGTQASGKKPCKEHDKSTCKITTGCAWNDIHKCVEEGAPE